MKVQFASISAPLPKADKRRSRRRVIRFGLDVSDVKEGSPLLILDVSEAGMQIQTVAKLGIGERLAVELPEAGSVTAEIRWRSRDRYGARFAAPISQAAISAIQLASPAKPNESTASRVEPSASDPLAKGNESAALLYSVMALACITIAAFLYVLWVLPISGF